MTTTNTLENYTKAMEELGNHQHANKAVFDAHQALVMRVIDAENALRDEVAVTKTGVQNDHYQVIVKPESQTFADIEAIDQMFNSGLAITKENRSQIIKTVERAVRIIIRPVK